MNATITEFDAATVRQLYSEVQNWARHYEQLIVNANVLIVSAGLVLVGLAFGDKVKPLESYALLAIPAVIAMVGIAMTVMLFHLYRTCIERLIRLEKLLGCADPVRMAGLDGQGPLVPELLHRIPISYPTSVRFFLVLHLVLLAAYVLFAGARLLPH
jgi:hypothetical protein